MNVVVIVLDTMRWDHLGRNGRLPVRTPNLDRFARRATRFERAIIGSFPTIPHRTDCFTGNVVFPRYDWKALGEEEASLPEAMRAAGYHTGFVADTKHMFRAQFDQRFDEARLTWNPPEDRPKPQDIALPIPAEHVRQDGAEYRSHLADMSHFRHESDWFVAQTAQTAAAWLQDNANREKWMLWLDTFEIHERWHAPQHYVDLYDPGYDGPPYEFPNYNYTDVYTKEQIRHLRACYAAEVTLTDRWIGHVLDQIDVMNLWDSTMVVVTSDHGMYLGEHRRMGKHTCDGADPWPLYEEVSHIPLLVWVPGLKAKRRVNALAQPCDLMATILDACGAKGPNIYGRSWLPLMTGERKRNWKVVFSSKHVGENSKIDYCPTRLTATTQRWTCILAEEGRPAELYDVKTDPQQKRNLAAKRPKIVARLRRDAIAFLREQQATESYVAKYV
ncbi:MAG: sulfatase [Candidatus Sumerlaeota bacterium]|nr:sulfatase [Candidatus Sumerlaeota bacterium]